MGTYENTTWSPTSEPAHVRAKLANDATGLVAEYHRHNAWPRTVNHRKVGMTKTGSRHLDQHLARPGCADLHGLDTERPRTRVGHFDTHFAQNCGLYSHAGHSHP